MPRSLARWLLMALAAGGTACQRPPVPPEPVNCVLSVPEDMRLGPPDEGQGQGVSDAAAWDTEIVARIRTSPAYETREAGDTTTVWMLVRADVIQVVRGRWTEREMRFTLVTRWIKAGAKNYELGAKAPYHRGWIFRFGLSRSSGDLPGIVYQQRLAAAPARLEPVAPSRRLAPSPPVPPT